MKNQIIASIGILWLRILAGAGIAYHGYGKVFGGQVQMMVEGVGKMGFPAPEFFAWAAALSELVGGIALVIGLGTRFAALFVFITMTVAAFMAHGSDPLKVKELALAYWCVSGGLVALGGGLFSMDFLFGKKKGI